MLGAGAFMSQASDDDMTVYSDSSNRSVTTINATDPGAVRLGEFNAELLATVSGNQTDAVRFLSQMGADGIRNMGESVTDLYAVAGQNSARAWDRTMSASEAMLARVLDASKSTTGAAQAVAQSAIASFQPAEKSNSDTMRYTLLAAAGLGLLIMFKKG